MIRILSALLRILMLRWSGCAITARPLPVMKLNPEVKTIDGFRYEDFELVGYDPLPHIKAPVSV